MDPIMPGCVGKAFQAFDTFDETLQKSLLDTVGYINPKKKHHGYFMPHASKFDVVLADL